MNRLSSALVFAAFALAACTNPSQPKLGPDGKPLPSIYRIKFGNKSNIQFRMLDSVNAVRTAAGASKLTLDSKLTAAAETHSRDMSVQNRPWHFGSDGSSPLDRVKRVGYEGTLVGENISESFETEVETLSAWMQRDDTRNVILEPKARKMGFAWYQESNGKIWWTLITGS